MTKKLLILSTICLILTAIACSADTPTVRHTVTFLNADDSVFHKIQVEDGQTVKQPTQDPVKAGYLLKGWSLQEDGSELFDFSTPVTADITLYPVFDNTITDPELNFEYIKKEDGTLSVKRYLNNMVGEVFTIPSEYEGMAITSIESEAFIYFRGGEIHIPASISSIGDQAFLMCYASIFVDEDNSNYTAVEGVLFNKDMTTLISCPSSKMGIYTVPDTVTVISDYAFSYSNPYLYSINLPKGIQEIGEFAFTLCSAKICTVEGSEYKATEEGVLFNKDMTTLISCPMRMQDSYTVPDSVTHIADYAFFGCLNLQSIYLPDKLTSIGECAFSGCNLITSFTIPESVEYINPTAFSQLNDLKEINVKDGNNSYIDIDGVLFDKNTTILICYPAAKTGTSYEIPNTVNTISELAFFGSDNLESITIPGSVTTIGANAFRFAIALKSITIPESITAIPGGAFSYCFALSSVTLPSKLISIGDDAFSFCSSLTKIEIPASVKTISSTAFRFAEDEGEKGIIEITVHKAKDSIPDAPWSAENATVIWNQN